MSSALHPQHHEHGEVKSNIHRRFRLCLIEQKVEKENKLHVVTLVRDDKRIIFLTPGITCRSIKTVLNIFIYNTNYNFVDNISIADFN